MAPHLAPLLHGILTKWWSHNPPFIPSCWRDGWLCMLAKPRKAPSCPQNLRPIALQEPIGKAVLGLVAKIALGFAFPHLVSWPLMAYLPYRSVLDCVLKVSQHCKAVRAMVTSQRGGPHLRASAQVRYKVCGGVQLFIDLTRAFDVVCRRKLFSRLSELGVPRPL